MCIRYRYGSKLRILDVFFNGCKVKMDFGTQFFRCYHLCGFERWLGHNTSDAINVWEGKYLDKKILHVFDKVKTQLFQFYCSTMYCCALYRTVTNSVVTLYKRFVQCIIFIYDTWCRSFKMIISRSDIFCVCSSINLGSYLQAIFARPVFSHGCGKMAVDTGYKLVNILNGQ